MRSQSEHTCRVIPTRQRWPTRALICSSQWLRTQLARVTMSWKVLSGTPALADLSTVSPSAFYEYMQRQQHAGECTYCRTVRAHGCSNCQGNRSLLQVHVSRRLHDSEQVKQPILRRICADEVKANALNRSMAVIWHRLNFNAAKTSAPDSSRIDHNKFIPPR